MEDRFSSSSNKHSSPHRNRRGEWHKDDWDRPLYDRWREKDRGYSGPDAREDDWDGSRHTRHPDQYRSQHQG